MSKSRIIFTKNQALNKTYLASHLLMLEEMSFNATFHQIREIAKKGDGAIMVYGYKQLSKNSGDKLVSTDGIKMSASKVLTTQMSDKCVNHVIRLYFPVIGPKRAHWYMLKCTRAGEDGNIEAPCKFEFEHVPQKVMGQVLKEIESII